MANELVNCDVSADAIISPDARIHPSVRGSRLVIGAHTYIYDFVVIRFVGGSGDIAIGEHCYINPHCVLYSGNGIAIGNYVLIAAGTTIMPTNHAIEDRSRTIRHQGFARSRGGVVIEDDVWIGANCALLDGTVIKTGAIIAAGSVVTGLIPPYTIWGGVPARMIKERP
jgi:virginiamycin A acetyltransferase